MRKYFMNGRRNGKNWFLCSGDNPLCQGKLLGNLMKKLGKSLCLLLLFVRYSFIMNKNRCQKEGIRWEK